MIVPALLPFGDHHQERMKCKLLPGVWLPYPRAPLTGSDKCMLVERLSDSVNEGKIFSVGLPQS